MELSKPQMKICLIFICMCFYVLPEPQNKPKLVEYLIDK